VENRWNHNSLHCNGTRVLPRAGRPSYRPKTCSPASRPLIRLIGRKFRSASCRDR
jgi:hypothetical protein